MPLVANSSLPTFERLREAGQEILSAERASRQDIRELHVGLLNMMPDAALQATERQFMRLLGACNRIAQIHVHPFSVDSGARGDEARAYIARHYERFEDLRSDGLDALVISGANPVHPDLTQEPFWNPLVEVMEWASENVCSVVCSCLATHAYANHFKGVERLRCEPDKRWGVYSHKNRDAHPLLTDTNTRFDAPHSHVYEMTAEQLRGAGLRILSESDEAGVYLAVSEDGFRFVFFQGHPEYDINSLLKEYKREVNRFGTGVRDEYPRYPEHYFGEAALEQLERYRERAIADVEARRTPPAFPEDELEPLLDNTWGDTGRGMFNNWLGLVYQLTHRERGIAFMDGVNPQDPLGLKVG